MLNLLLAYQNKPNILIPLNSSNMCSIKSFGSAPCLTGNFQEQKEAFLKFQSINSQLFAMIFDWLKIKKD